MAGADACYLTAEITFPKLATKCGQLLKHYSSKAYTKNFSFVDQVRPIRDEALIEVLNGKLANAMKNGDTSALGFALPDIGGYQQIHNFRAYRRKWTRDFEDLTASEILQAYNGDHPDADDQSDVSIDALKDDGNPVDTFTLRECAVFQVAHKGQLYVLTLNKWYVVNSDYADQVDDQVKRLAVIKERSFLPTLVKGTPEGEYNESAADGRRLALMDKKLVRPAGATSAIEVCDLFSKEGEFIHVKKHTRSATLSHLLAQGAVSARLFIDDSGYRKTFRKALPPEFRPLIDPGKVEASKHNVVYAISSPPTKSVPGQLPFFSKVNLLFHCREIQRMGMVPKLFHIHEV